MMTNVMIMILLVLLILLIVPHIIKRVVYKKLTTALANKDYTTFEQCLDGFLCTFSYRPYNREYMRLTSYYMQNDKKKIEIQLNSMFHRLKMHAKQNIAVSKQAFYFYMEYKEYAKAKQMLDNCKRNNASTNEVEVMEMMYHILALKRSDYIQEIKRQLDIVSRQKDVTDQNALRVKIGIFEYLLGLQYAYQNNKKVSQKFLKSALEHCKHTPYEYEIKNILKVASYEQA